MRVLRWSIPLFALLFILGCEKSKPKVGKVQGTITLDGTGPLNSGEIMFESEGSGKPPVQLPITGGKYEGEVPVGKHKIAIYSYVQFTVPKGQPGEGSQSKNNILPEKYNQKSTEQREVTEAGPNNFDFKVTSK